MQGIDWNLARFTTCNCLLSLGSADGAGCDPALVNSPLDIGNAASGQGAALNGRFRGGYITRHYGQLQDNIHALQLQMRQRSCMRKAMPFDYLPESALDVPPHLRRMIVAVLGSVRTARMRTFAVFVFYQGTLQR